MGDHLRFGHVCPVGEGRAQLYRVGVVHLDGACVFRCVLPASAGVGDGLLRREVRPGRRVEPGAVHAAADPRRVSPRSASGWRWAPDGELVTDDYALTEGGGPPLTSLFGVWGGGGWRWGVAAHRTHAEPQQRSRRKPSSTPGTTTSWPPRSGSARCWIPSSPDGSQEVSAYDPNWMANYGGCDGVRRRRHLARPSHAPPPTASSPPR